MTLFARVRPALLSLALALAGFSPLALAGFFPLALAGFFPLALASLAPSALCGCTGDAGAEGPVQNRVEMKITDKGFEPQNLRVKKGEPVTLIITRKTDVTCATEIVIDDYNINVKLPLNQPVTVKFTPNKTGQLKYGCAMKKMIGGVIKVL